MAGIAPGYNINPATATPEELQKFLGKSYGRFQSSNAQRAAALNNPWQSMRATAATHAEPYDNLFRGREGMFADPSYGITKIPSVRPTTEGGQWSGGGYDYNNANWDPIRQQIADIGSTWNKNAASRTNGNIFSGPLSIAASFGLPILAPGMAGLSALGKFSPVARAAGIAAGNVGGGFNFGKPSSGNVLNASNSFGRNGLI